MVLGNFKFSNMKRTLMIELCLQSICRSPIAVLFYYLLPLTDYVAFSSGIF